MSKQSVLSLSSLQIKYISNSVFMRKRGREKGNRRKPVVSLEFASFHVMLCQIP